MTDLDRSMPDGESFPSGMPAGDDGGASAGAGDVAKSAVQQAPAVASQAKDHAKEVAAEATGHAKAVATEVKDQISGLVGQGREELTTQAEAKSQQAASGLRSLSEQLSALKEGRTSEAGPLSNYVDEARSKVVSLADRLENGGASGAVDDVTAFARRRPGMFLAGAAVAGFLIGRLVRGGAAAASESNDEPATPELSMTGSVAGYTPPVGDTGAFAPPSPTFPPTADGGLGERADAWT